MNQLQNTTSISVQYLHVSHKEMVTNIIRLILSVIAGFVILSVATAVYQRATSPRVQLEVTPKQFNLGDVAQGRYATAAVTLTN